MKKLLKFLPGTALLCLVVSCLFLSSGASALTGSGTEESPYVISTASELQAIGDDLDAHYELGGNINLSRLDFEPIGNEWDGPFTGTLDGKGFTISNMNVTSPDLKYTGLFGYLEGTVCNLKLDNVYVSGGRFAGGVAGTVGVGGVVTDCEVLSGTVAVSGSPMRMAAGGITGVCEGTVTRCSNGANVLVNGDGDTGGIIGRVNEDLAIDGCVNRGAIHTSSFGEIIVAGGIIGFVNNSEVIVTSCENSESVSTSQYADYGYCGGIIGRSSGSRTSVKGCNNSGSITAIADYSRYAYSGGIIGRGATEISECTNSGAIKADAYSSYSGGMVGYDCSAVTNCENYGNISSEAYSGAMVGYYCSTITNCNNYGDVSSGRSSGGVVGENCGTVTGCNNYGDISSSGEYSGGIVGYYCNTVTSCNNYGNVSSEKYSGGVVGDSCDAIDGCSNCGTISAEYYSGGIIGKGSQGLPVITGCTNYGTIESERSFTGGIYGEVYLSEPPISLCANMGSVSGGYDETVESSTSYITISDTKSYPKAMFSITPYAIQIGISDRFYCSDLRVSSYSPSGTGYPLSQLRDSSTYPASFNMGTDWVIDPDWNSGLPMPTGFNCYYLSESVLFLQVGSGEVQLDSQFEAVRWGSLDPTIASCENGLVTAKRVGTTMVSAWDADGHRANCIVYVYEPRDSVLAGSQYEMRAGATLTIPVTLPDDDPQGIVWSSSNPAVASVSQTGIVTGNKSGTVTITATLPLSGISESCTIEVIGKAVTKVQLTNTSVNIGDSKPIPITITPSEYEDSFTWRSGDESIATVVDGVVTGHSVGSTTITATAASGVSGSCTVTVLSPSSSITLSDTAITLEAGTSYLLTATLVPEDSTDTLTWTSGSTSIASVSSSGLVTAKSAGTTFITVKSSSGQIATCQVTVKSKAVLPQSVTLSQTEASMAVGESLQLTAAIEPSNTTMPRLTWSSSDPDTVSVNNAGAIKALAPGSAEIRVETENGLYDLCRVRVAAASSAGFVIMDSRAKSGASAETAVHIVKNPGVAAFTVEVSYDSSLLTPLSITAGECLAGGTLTSNLDTLSPGDTFHVTWYSAQDVSSNGLAFTIEWQTSGSGTSPISLVYDAGDICNSDQQEVRFSMQAGSVIVLDRAVGDIYYDNEVNMKDIVYFARWFNEQESLDDNQRLSADVFFDGELNVKDLSALAELLNSSLDPEPAANGLRRMSNAETFNITVSDAVVDANGDATFTVSGAQCPGVAAFRFGVQAPEGYSVTGVAACSDLPGSDKLTYNAETGIVSWYSDSTTTLEGELFVVTLHTDAAVPAFGEITLSYVPGDFFEAEDYTPISISVAGGRLTGETAAKISNVQVIGDKVKFTVTSNTACTVNLVAALYDSGRSVHTVMLSAELPEGAKTFEVDISCEASWDAGKILLLTPGTFKPISSAACFQR